jgi:hypothetical protein
LSQFKTRRTCSSSGCGYFIAVDGLPVPHRAHDDRKIASALQHPDSVIVATTLQDQFFRKLSLKLRLPKFPVHGHRMSRSRESQEDPGCASLPAARLQLFQSAITEWHEPSPNRCIGQTLTSELKSCASELRRARAESGSVGAERKRAARGHPPLHRITLPGFLFRITLGASFASNRR